MSTSKIKKNWRDDPGLIFKSFYKKKFAILPVVCSDGLRVWMTVYYKKYVYWGREGVPEHSEYGHIDFIEDISETEFIVRKLAENL